MFHKTLTEWRQQVSRVANQPTEKAARWANVFFDFDLLHGDAGLVGALQRHVFEEMKRSPRLLRMMVAHDAEGKPPLGLFNRLLTQNQGKGKTKGKGKNKSKGTIDVKRNGLRIVADGARIYAVAHGLDTHNTGDRLSALVREGVLGADVATTVSIAYEELLDLLLEHQLTQLRRKENLDKKIPVERLPRLRYEALRLAMMADKQFQQRLQADFDFVEV